MLKETKLMNIHDFSSLKAKPIKWHWWKQWVHCRLSSYAKRDKAHTRKLGSSWRSTTFYNAYSHQVRQSIYERRQIFCLFVMLRSLKPHGLLLCSSPRWTSWFHYVYVSTYSGNVIGYLIKFSLKIHLNQKKKKKTITKIFLESQKWVRFNEANLENFRPKVQHIEFWVVLSLKFNQVWKNDFGRKN
jgi:hypothetical protein